MPDSNDNADDNADKQPSLNDADAQVKLIALVLTFNGERVFKQCLESLNFCQQILVIDSYSNDQTLAIAQENKATLIQNKWQGAGKQFEFAFDYIAKNIVAQDPKHKYWILSLDQDEICSPELRQSIEATLKSSASLEHSAYSLNRKSWYFDRFMLHSSWHPDWLARLFQFGQLDITVNGAHYSFCPKGKSGKLNGLLLHYPYSSFANQLDKLNSYAQQGATELLAKGKKGGILQGLLHAKWCFLRKYILKRGFLDGKAGFILAMHDSFYTFIKYVRVSEAKWGDPYDKK